jgi:hypothetical protein
MSENRFLHLMEILPNNHCKTLIIDCKAGIVENIIRYMLRLCNARSQVVNVFLGQDFVIADHLRPYIASPFHFPYKS